MMINFDPNFDYEQLLSDTKAQWKSRMDRLEGISKLKYSLMMNGYSMKDPDFQKLEEDEIDAKIKYQNWIKKNITDRGILLHVNHSWHDMPLSLSIPVAG